MNIIIDITPDPDNEDGYLYALYTENAASPGDITLIGSGQENTLDAVFQNLQSLTERTI